MAAKRKRPSTIQAPASHSDNGLPLPMPRPRSRPLPAAVTHAPGGRGRQRNRSSGAGDRCEASPSSGNRDTSASLDRSRSCHKSPRHEQLRQRQQQQQQLRAASRRPEPELGQRKGSAGWKQDQHQHQNSQQHQQQHNQHHVNQLVSPDRQNDPKQRQPRRKRQRQQLEMMQHHPSPHQQHQQHHLQHQQQQHQQQQQQQLQQQLQQHKQGAQQHEFPPVRSRSGESDQLKELPQPQHPHRQHHQHQQQQQHHHHHHLQQQQQQQQQHQQQRQQSPQQARASSGNCSAASSPPSSSSSSSTWQRRAACACASASPSHPSALGRQATASSSGGGSFHLLKHLETSLPVPKRLELVEDCLERVRLVVRQLWGAEAALVLQGSYAQGLAVGSSDLDIAIVPNGHSKSSASQATGSKRQSKRQRRRSKRRSDDDDDDNDENVEADGEALNSQGNVQSPPEDFDYVDRKKAVGLLKHLARAVAELDSEELRVHQQILHAQVPILRLVGRSEGVSKVIIDISVGTTLYRGVCDRYVHRLMESDPSGRAAALCRAVKLWAKKRRLSDTMRGGMSSFSWVLLVIFFLQNSREFGLPTLDNLCGGITKASRDGRCSKQHHLPAKGQEASLVLLLKKFFDWVADGLPEHSRASLSVLSGRAEVLSSTAARGHGTNKTVFIQVPFKPNDNAARCLRSDVWGRQIVPELSRVRNLLTQLHQGTERQKAFAVNSLFAARGSAADGPIEEDFSSENEDSDGLSAAFRRESSVESNAPKRRRRSSNEIWHEVSRSCETGRSPSLGPLPPGQGQCQKEKEKETEKEKEKEKERKKAASSSSSQPTRDLGLQEPGGAEKPGLGNEADVKGPVEAPPQAPPPVPASVSRFLHLRAMMSGGLAA